MTAIVKNQNRKKLEKLLSKKTQENLPLKKLQMKSVKMMYTTKPNPTTSGSAGSGPPSTLTREPALDYYTLTYDDLSDPD